MTTYTYSVQNDLADGVNALRLSNEIRASAITVALDHIDVSGDDLMLVFKADLPTEDLAVLDGGQTGPAGGLLAAHDSAPVPPGTLPVEFLKPQFTWPKPANIGDRLWEFAYVFTHKETWWHGSIRVEDEIVGTGDGETKDFLLAHPFVIDLDHGLVSEERKIVPSQLGAQYKPIIRLDDVPAAEKKHGFLFFDPNAGSSSSSGGDPFEERDRLVAAEYADVVDPDGAYCIDYKKGIISFHTPPAQDVEIKATYYYSPLGAGSEFYLEPPAGKVFLLTDVEIQYTEDLVLTDEVRVGLQMYYPTLAPPPFRIDIPQSMGIYKGVHDFVNWSRGSFPVIPKAGGPIRGNKSPIIQLRFEYKSPVELYPSAGMRFKVWLPNHRPFRGSYASLTFYGVVVDE